MTMTTVVSTATARQNGRVRLPAAWPPPGPPSSRVRSSSRYLFISASFAISKRTLESYVDEIRHALGSEYFHHREENDAEY